MASIRNVSLVMVPLSRLVASLLPGVSAVAENHVSAVSKYRYRYRDGRALAHTHSLYLSVLKYTVVQAGKVEVCQSVSEAAVIDVACVSLNSHSSPH